MTTRWRRPLAVAAPSRPLAAVALAVLAVAANAPAAFGAGEVGVSPTGPASGSVVAASGTGSATQTGPTGVAVSGGGSATSSGSTGVAVAGVGNATATGSTGVAVSGTGQATGGAADVDPYVNWVDTPEGPVGVGAGVGELVQAAEEVASKVEGAVEEHRQVASTDPANFLCHEVTNLACTLSGFYGTGGTCPTGVNCNNLKLIKTPVRMTTDHRPSQLEATVVFAWLVPITRSSNCCITHVRHTFSTVTGDDFAICGIKVTVRPKGTNAENGFHYMEPSGDTNIPSGTTRSVDYGIEVPGFKGGVNYSHQVHSGKVRGSYSPSKSSVTGSWRTNHNYCPAHSGGSAALENSSVFTWARDPGAPARYGLGGTITYQTRWWDPS